MNAQTLNEIADDLARFRSRRGHLRADYSAEKILAALEALLRSQALHSKERTNVVG